MTSRKGFTLIELLVVVVIIGIVVALIFGSVGGCSSDPVTGKGYYELTNTGDFRCINTYVHTTGGSESTDTSKRVVLEPVGGGSNETMLCDDDFYAGIHNSGTLYAQFEKDKYYRVTYIGFRKEGVWARFPTVKSVTRIER